MRLTFEDGQFVLHRRATSEIVDLEAAARFRRHADDVAERVLNRALIQRYPLPPMPPFHFLDAHQREGIEWILTRSRSYLAHAPGAGKTAEAVVASELAGSGGQVLFIVPPSLTVNWAREIEKFTALAGLTEQICGKISIVPLSAKRQEMDWTAKFIVCPDSLLTRPWVHRALSRLTLKLIAVDEASRFKEAESARTKALFGGVIKGRPYRSLVKRARHAVLLDGSPLMNRPMELWAPVYGMAPEVIDFKDQQDFGLRYCGATMNDYGHWEFKHSSHEAELKAKLQKDFMHVVTESQLSHPERRRSLLFMNQDPRTPKMKSWEKSELKALKFDDIGEDMSRGDIATYRRELGERKVPWVSEYIRERLANSKDSILLFAWHRDVIGALAESFPNVERAVIMGGTSESYREDAFRDFQNGRIRLIIGNIGAMGRGHNLQTARRVVFAEYSWTDELNKQCEKRASRRGSTHAFVRCEYVVVPNSIDEIVLNAVFTKAKTTKKVIG